MTKGDDPVYESAAEASIRSEPAPSGTATWVQRVGVLCRLPSVLGDLGVEPAAVLAAAGLPPDALNLPDRRIPFESAPRVLREASRQSACSHIGVLVGRLFSVSQLGNLGELMANSATVSDALRSYAVHQRLYSQGFAPFLFDSRDRTQFGAVAYHPNTVELAPAYDTLLAAAVTLIRELLRSDWAPTEVHFPHAQRPNAKLYQEHFRCKLRFDAEQAMLVFPSAVLKRGVVDADPARLRALQAHVSEHMDTELLPLLYRSLRLLMLRGSTAAAALAQSLAMHERTLSRRLRAQGTSFRAVLDDVRYEVARQLLAETNLKVTRIAAVLGYADGATFCKAFQRWSGTAPREWRVGARRAEAA